MEKKMRYGMIDTLRGFALINMLLFHLLYDLKYIVKADIPWYTTESSYWWQQGICWGFVLISGISWNLGKRRLRRGLEVFLAGLVITAVTYLVIPSERIFFGVLSFLGAAMLLMIPADRWLRKWNPVAGLGVSLVLFGFCKHIADGYLGFFGVPVIRLPEQLYANHLTTALGFPFQGFYSSDYVPLLPGFFMFAAGYFLWKWIGQKEKVLAALRPSVPGLAWMGRNSLWIYMLHQPVLMGILMFLFGI